MVLLLGLDAAGLGAPFGLLSALPPGCPGHLVLHVTVRLYSPDAPL